MHNRLIALFLLIASLGGCKDVLSPEARYQPEKAGTVDRALCLLGFAAVPMRSLMTGHQLVDARINGMPATLVVDTGANVTVLHAGAESRFRATRDPLAIGSTSGLGGPMQGRVMRIDTLALGGVETRQRRVIESDLSALTAVLGRVAGRDIDGIVGQDVLQKQSAVIDVAGGILYLMAAGTDPAPIDPARCAAKPRPKAAKPDRN